MERKVKAIKTQRLAGYLMLNGFIMLRTEKDYKNPKYDVYLFEASEELEKAVKGYVEMYKK